MIKLSQFSVRSVALVWLIATFGCTSHVKKTDAETLSLKQEVRELVGTQKALTSRLGMLAERLARMEDRLAVQEARVNVSLPELPIVKLVPRESAPAKPTAPTPAITQGDVEPKAPKIPKIARYKPSSTSKRKQVRSLKKPLERKVPQVQRASVMTEPKDVIARATRLVNERKYKEALQKMSTFRDEYPRSPLREYALLIEGRAYFGSGAAQDAIRTFEELIEVFPSGRTVPDALYMIGLSQDRLGQTGRAVETLARLKTIYPATEAGKRAAAALSDRQQSL